VEPGSLREDVRAAGRCGRRDLPGQERLGQWTSIPKLHVNEATGITSCTAARSGTIPRSSRRRCSLAGSCGSSGACSSASSEHYPEWYTEPSTDPEDPQHEYAEYFFAGKIEGQFYGEDHSFSKRIREMGTKMFIYPNVNLTHWGYKGFEGTTAGSASRSSSTKKQLREEGRMSAERVQRRPAHAPRDDQDRLAPREPARGGDGSQGAALLREADSRMDDHLHSGADRRPSWNG
jgi:hypothetical protein